MIRLLVGLRYLLPMWLAISLIALLAVGLWLPVGRLLPVSLLPIGLLPIGLLPIGLLPKGLLPIGLLPIGLLPREDLLARGLLAVRLLLVLLWRDVSLSDALARLAMKLCLPAEPEHSRMHCSLITPLMAVLETARE